MKNIFLLMLVFFIGCTTKPPKWYLTPYNDTQTTIYASASGKTKIDAINNALSLAASKISVTINSIFQSTKEYYKTNNSLKTYSNVSQIITSTIKNFEFNNYKILKIEKKDKFYVLISVDRIKNSNYLYQKALNNYQKLKENLKLDDKLKILKTYPKIIKQIDKNISNLYIAKSLYNNPNIDNLIKKFINLKNKLVQRLQNTAFKIKNDKFNIIKDTLSTLNLNLANNGNIEISSNSIINKYEINNYKIFTLILNIKIKNKTQINFSINCAGKSIGSYNVAKSFAIKDCKEKLKEKLKEIIQIPY